MTQDNEPNAKGGAGSKSPRLRYRSRAAAAPSAAWARSSRPIRSPAPVDVGADRHEPRPLGLRPATFPDLRLRRGQRPLRLRLEPVLPQITRKTDKGLPQYDDAAGVGCLHSSGAEDLVPVSGGIRMAKWVPETLPDRAIGSETFQVRRYRPRIEGLFARIERWTAPHGRRHPLALDLQDNVSPSTARTRSRGSPIRPTRAHLQLADLRDPRRQGQRDRLRVQGGGRRRRRPDPGARAQPR